MPDNAEPTEAEVEAVVEEFGGDLKAAIRALLFDLAVLAADFGAVVSWGYVRGKGSPGARGRGRTVNPTEIKRDRIT